MISRILGNLVSVDDSSVVVRVGGLEYRVFVPGFLVDRLGSLVGEDVELYTIYYIEGSAGVGNLFPRLVGFLRREDREFFEYFITVPGLGIRRALRALNLPVEEVARAIELKDYAVLRSLPEIGNRIAEKIVAELRGKVARFAAPGEAVEEIVGAESTAVIDEALAVLSQLGYKPVEARSLVARAVKYLSPPVDSETLIREIFRRTGRK